MELCASHWRLMNHYRRMLQATVVNEIRMRYAGSIFGLTWLVLYPLLLLGTYAAVYLCIFKVRFELFTSNEYVIFIFCGLVPFLGFSEALVMGVSCITSNSNLVKNTMFPVELLAIKAVLTSQCTQLAGMVMLLLVLLAVGQLMPSALLVIGVWLCQLGFSVGLAWMLGSFNIVIRDLQTVISVIVMVLMMISPIAYTPEMVPHALRPLVVMNPLAHFIAAYQGCLVLHKPPSLTDWLILVGLSCCSLSIGYYVVTRLKVVFADNV